MSASPIPNGQSSQRLPSPLSHLTASLLGLHSTQIHPLDILASTYPSTVGYHWSSWVCRCYWLAPSGLPARRRTPGRWAVDGRGPALALHSPPGHLQLPGTTGHHNNQTTPHWPVVATSVACHHNFLVTYLLRYAWMLKCMRRICCVQI